MLELILGRTGSGKTARVKEEIQELLNSNTQHIFLLVPEQQLFSVERELLPSLPSDETERLTLTSFTKICDTLEETYGGRTHTTLSKAAASLLMWMNLRELSGLLESYGNVPSGDVTLTRMMLETTKELTSNGVTTEALESVARQLDPTSPLSKKLRDMALINASYHRLVEDMCGKDPADRLLRACETVRKHGYFKNAVIFVDSFISFTAQEYAMLSLMMAQSDRTVVTLGIEDPLTKLPQFESLRDTYTRLGGLAAKHSVERRVTRLIRIATNDEISRLEETLWDFSAPPFEPLVDIPSKVRLFTAPNPYEEAEAAALHILELVNSGISYEEIAVIIRDIEGWRGILDAVFDQYHIPYFISEKTDLNTKPAARLLLLALRCVSRHWQIGDIMSLCKTGLCGIEARKLDDFETYTETWHLSGKRMTEPVWSMNPDGYTTKLSPRGKEILDVANRVREKVMTPLLALEVKLQAAETVTDQCRALYEYLRELSIKQQLSEQGKLYLDLGNVREAGEAVRLWTFMNEALSTLAVVSESTSGGNAPLTSEELGCALSLIYAETDIGSVPARHNCVMIGTADTLRVDRIKASLILGLCEGEFPRAVSDRGLFSEQDKALMAQNGVELSSRMEMQTSEELLYVYRAMAKPTDKLYLSRSLSGTDGKERSPSAAFTRVQYLFPYLKVTHFTTAYLSDDNASVFAPATQDELPRERVYALLGDELWLSKSKLQRYAQCPYSYFGSYVLGLRERITAKVDNNVSGQFLHHVLECFLKNAIDKDGHVKALSEEAIEALDDRIISAYLREINHSLSLMRQGRFLHTFARLRAVAIILIRDMLAELKQSSFAPIGFEWDTHGYRTEDPSPMILPLDDRDICEEALPTGIGKGSSVLLKMGGVIDRVDVYRTEDGKKAYVRVVDYKSSKHELSEKTLTEDMDIQLLLYLFTLCSESNRRLFANEDGSLPEVVLPAQAMYLSPDEDSDTGEVSAVRTGLLLEDEAVLRAVSHELNEAFLPLGVKFSKDGSLSGKALCSESRMEALETLLYDTIRGHAGTMYSGIAYRTPSKDGCKFCKMREGCPLAIESTKY